MLLRMRQPNALTKFVLSKVPPLCASQCGGKRDSLAAAAYGLDPSRPLKLGPHAVYQYRRATLVEWDSNLGQAGRTPCPGSCRQIPHCQSDDCSCDGQASGRGLLFPEYLASAFGHGPGAMARAWPGGDVNLDVFSSLFLSLPLSGLSNGGGAGSWTWSTLLCISAAVFRPGQEAMRGTKAPWMDNGACV